jgi:two-component sensor histidine kinase
MTYQLTQQDHLIHDLKAPIEIISRLQNTIELGYETRKQLESCSSYLKELIGHYFKSEKSTTKGDSISACISNKMSLFNEITFKTEYQASIDQFVFLKIDQLKFNRVLFNLLSNSRQSLQKSGVESPQITIKTKNDHQYFYLSLSDNGCGFPPSILNGFINTSSELGQGIGLSSVKSIISESGGSIQLENHECGAQIFLQIPIIFKDATQIVLFEDQPIFSHYWSNDFEKSCLKAHFCINPKVVHDKNTIIFIDVKLKDQCGLELAKEFYQKGFYNIFLTTNYSQEKFKDIDYIKGVIDKNSPFQYFRYPCLLEAL